MLRPLAQQLKLGIKKGEQKAGVGQTTNIFNIDTLNQSDWLREIAIAEVTKAAEEKSLMMKAIAKRCCEAQIAFLEGVSEDVK